MSVCKWTNLVGFTFSPNGSNEMVTRFTPFKFTNFTFLLIAETNPPDLFHVPLWEIDISIVFYIWIVVAQHSRTHENCIFVQRMSSDWKVRLWLGGGMVALSSVRKTKYISFPYLNFICVKMQNFNRKCIFFGHVPCSSFVASLNACSIDPNLSIPNIVSPAPVPFAHLETLFMKTNEMIEKRHNNNWQLLTFRCEKWFFVIFDGILDFRSLFSPG